MSQPPGMSSSADPPNIVVIRRRRREPFHPRGAWKVAFADLVTALMALFLLLWLMGSGETTRQAVAVYFEDPRTSEQDLRKKIEDSGGVALSRQDLESLAQDIRRAVRELPDVAELEEYVEISLSVEGLRIELLETNEGMFFESAAPTPTDIGRETLLTIAGQLAKLPNPLAIEGHTDARPYNGRPDYSNWELSTDRANAARRILLEGGVPEERIKQVRGFAAGRPRPGTDPADPGNRRVSLIALYEPK